MAEITAIAQNPEGEMVVVNVAKQAVKKLERELASNKEPYEQAIINYLIGRVKESNSLATDVIQPHKTWERCWKYIYSKASKAPRKDNCAIIEDKVVFEWAEDYYIKDDKAEAEKEAADAAKAKNKTDKKASKPSGTDKKKAGKTAKAKEVKAEPDPVPPETDDSAEPDEAKPVKAEKPKKAAKAEKKEKAPKAPDRDAPDKKESKEKKKPKKDKQIEGQMSLEDLFGGF